VWCAEVFPRLGVSDDAGGAARRQQHAGADLAGVGTFFFPVNILRADGDTRVLRRRDRNMQVDKGWTHDDFIAIVSGDEGQEVPEEVATLIRGFVHLPIGGDDFFSHEEAFSMLMGEMVPAACSFSAAVV